MDTMPCKLGAYRLPRGVAGHGAVIIMHLDRVRVNAHLTLDPSCYLSCRKKLVRWRSQIWAQEWVWKLPGGV